MEGIGAEGQVHGEGGSDGVDPDMDSSIENDIVHSQKMHGEYHPEKADNISDEIPVHEGINTRFKGQKHVRIYQNDFSMIPVIIPKPIVNPTHYSSKNNFDVTNFRATDKSLFRGRHIALDIHKKICSLPLCEICNFANLVSQYSWDSKNYLRYLTPLDHLSKLPTRNMKKKKVTFDVEVTNKTDRGQRPFNLNISTVRQACAFNVSFIVTMLLVQNSRL